MIDFLESSEENEEVDFLLEIGIHHEMQHQELLYMDIKAILGNNPSLPPYSNQPLPSASPKVEEWKSFGEGIYEIGSEGMTFAYDNEKPRHKSYLYPFAVSSQIVTSGEYLQFVEDGGYADPSYWLSEGWDWVNQEKVEHPLYWYRADGKWFEYTLHGAHPLDLHAPVVHVSYFEASAFATWKRCRLPTEEELELFLRENFDEEERPESALYHPNRSDRGVGEVWYWTKSQYSQYPGYQTFKGLIREYNGKFMCNQFVLKGGCIATPDGHYRHSYRNFYYPQQRWMFSGIRLAKDL